jgi:hypothetical protein
MGPLPAKPFNKDFDLDQNVLGVGSAEKITVAANTDPDVLNAILNDFPFPTRPSGKIEIGKISLEADAGKEISFHAGQAKIGFNAAAAVGAGVGVYDKAADAIASLSLNVPSLDLCLKAADASRYLVMLWRYNISGTVSASHPIGVVGSVSAKVNASRDALYAVVHAFPRDRGAQSVMADAASSWRLPRHVAEDEGLKIKPLTWLIAETDAAVAVHIAAQVGYDFSLIQDLRALGATREIGAKIDAGLKASFGFSVSGKYLVVLGRESGDAASLTVRLRLFKQSDRAGDFGVSLTVGVSTKADLPSNIHDLVKAVFGVHGQQIVKDLELLEKWTDPTKDLRDTVAGLINSTGLRLLTETTGIDAKAEFNKARGIVLDAVKKWKALPDQLSATLWKVPETSERAATDEFANVLRQLTGPDEAAASAVLEVLIGQAVFGDSPQAKWLSAIADTGLAAVAGNLGRVRELAAQTLGVLDGGVIGKVQTFIEESLSLDKVLKVVAQEDFDALNGWLVKRLSNFFEGKLEFSNIKPVQAAIRSVLDRSEQIYEKGLKALNSRYKFEFAASYASSTTHTALLDVVFDLNQPGVRGVLKGVLSDSDLDQLLVKPVAGITLNQATLTHAIKRTATSQVHMPMFTFESKHMTESMAKLTARDNGGRVLLCELDASDTVVVKGRFSSQLSALTSLQVTDGQVRIGFDKSSTVSYEDRHVQKELNFQQIRNRTETFAKTYLGGLVGTDVNAFYQRIQDEITATSGAAGGTLGDGVFSMQVSYPAQVLEAWFRARTPEMLKSDSLRMSRAIQAAFRDILVANYFRDADRLKNLGSATPLLVWAALPVSTGVAIENGQVRFNKDRDVFWDFPDRNLRKAMALDGHTTRSLLPRLREVRAVLLASGNGQTAEFFTDTQAGELQKSATNGRADVLLNSLLFAEAEIIAGAVKALKDTQNLLPDLKTSPTKAIRSFANFGADLTETFNSKVKSTYGDDSLRTLGPALLMEATKALSGGAVVPAPDALLSFAVLNANHTYVLGSFVDGEIPDAKQIAFSKTIVGLTQNLSQAVSPV